MSILRFRIEARLADTESGRPMAVIDHLVDEDGRWVRRVDHEAEVERWKTFYREVASDNRAKAQEVERLSADLAAARAERDGLAKAARDLVDSWDWWQVDPYDREGPDLRYLRAALAALPTPPEEEA
jgi:hypothetical protein